MGSDTHDVGLRVILEGGPLEPKFLISALDEVESALYNSDRQDIIRFFESAKRNEWFRSAPYEMMDLVRDASLERIRAYRHRRVEFSRFRDGSLILEGTVVAVAIWVIKETIGKSFSQSWIGSEWDNRFRDFFGSIFDSKIDSIAQGLRSAPRLLKDAKISVVRLRNVIEVRVSRRKNDRAPLPTIGEFLDKR